MKKVWIILILVLALVLPVFAATTYVSDGEDVFSEREEQLLSQSLDSLSAQYDIEIAVVTTPGFAGKPNEDYAEDCWEKLTGGKDGVLLVFSMTQRKYDIYYTAGWASVFESSALDKLEDAVVSKLSADDPYGATMAFAQTAGEILEADAKEKASWAWKTPLICFGVGAVIALIVVLAMVSQHKNVHRKARAGDYVTPGSFQLTKCLDLYLYQTTTRRRKPQNNSSGGRSSGGGGGHRSGSF